jgi:hypothetical protein
METLTGEAGERVLALCDPDVRRQMWSRRFHGDMLLVLRREDSHIPCDIQVVGVEELLTLSVTGNSSTRGCLAVTSS